MSQFTLIWDSSKLASNANATEQNALYRYRLVGGSYISTGFTPANPLAINAVTSDSPVLDNNKVIQFKISTTCTSNGPTDNDDGIKEVIEFESITPTITKDESSSDIVEDVTGLDMTKARFSLKKSSDNTTVGTPTIVNRVGNSISFSQSGLVYNTNYYWQVELYATVNTVDTISEVFSPYPFTTDAPAVCNPTTSVAVTSIEV